MVLTAIGGEASVKLLRELLESLDDVVPPRVVSPSWSLLREISGSKEFSHPLQRGFSPGESLATAILGALRCLRPRFDRVQGSAP